MKDLLIEEQTNKMVVENHRWRFSENRLEYLTQKIRHTISIFKGEWFMNRDIGIPYIPDQGINRNMHRRLIETALQVRIMEIKGVKKMVSFTSILNTGTRELTVTFVVQIDTGETIKQSVNI